MATQAAPATDSRLSHDLLEKYNTHGPRYTSYPTAPIWTEAFGPDAYREAIETTNQGQALLPLSVYTHIPFCESQCLFCSCNVVITKQHEHAEKYLNYLYREMEQVAQLMDKQRQVVQFHWGGGTPTYLSLEQMEQLFTFQSKWFQFSPESEIAIEVDPRVTTLEQLKLLKDLGFNRISMGVQDFNPQVQEAIHRIQPLAMTAKTVDACRQLGFESLNFDLIYGLPYQSVESFAQTLKEVIEISPDRIALYNFAYVPWLSPHQKRIPEQALPQGHEKFDIFLLALNTLRDAGYVYIGMDHFAKPNDDLTIALEEKRLHRNFMGYTVQHGVASNGAYETDLYGFGVSAISNLYGYYAQNLKKLPHYYEYIDAKTLPVKRGYALSPEDLLRRQVILSILCQGELRFKDIEAAFGISVKTHFADALSQLEGPTSDGFLTWDDDGFQLTPLGRIFSRNIAMPFDAYLKQPQASEKHPVFSKTL